MADFSLDPHTVNVSVRANWIAFTRRIAGGVHQPDNCLKECQVKGAGGAGASRPHPAALPASSFRSLADGRSSSAATLATGCHVPRARSTTARNVLDERQLSSSANHFGTQP